jgi:hypothetical protein
MKPVLVPLERVRYHIPQAAVADDRLLSSLTATVSDAIRSFCRRDFTLGNYDEVLPGQEGPFLVLRHHPIVSIQDVRTDPRPVLQIINTNPTTNQLASVEVVRDGIVLYRVASGSANVAKVTYASNATLSALATAINALGNGWSATAISPFGLFPSRELFVDRGFERGYGHNARLRTASLKLHTEPLDDFVVQGNGCLAREGLDPWRGNHEAFRVRYTAGYPEVPEDIQQACILWVAELWALAKRDPRLVSTATSDTTAGTASSTSYLQNPPTLPPAVRSLISPHRRMGV